LQKEIYSLGEEIKKMKNKKEKFGDEDNLKIFTNEDINFSLINSNNNNNNNNNKTKNFEIEESEAMDYEEEINNYKIQIESLKELIYEKENEAIKILQENEELKKEIKSGKNENEIGDNNNMIINSTFSSRNSELKEENKLIFKEKYNKMKASCEQYKSDNTNLMEQMNMLKNELKKEREKLQSLFTLEGKIKDTNEFIDLCSKLFDGFKPKNKIQEDAFKKFNSCLVLLQNQNQSEEISLEKDKDKSKSIDSEGKKNGFFGKFFKKGK